MPFTVRALPWDKASHDRELLLTREWIVTNGLGGYASGTVSGAITRKYHGLLISALPAPMGRTVMWSYLSETLEFADGETVSLGAEERAGGQLDLRAADYLHEFRLEDGLPVWSYRVRDLLLEKRVVMLHLQNTVYLSYRLLHGKDRPLLRLRPAFHFRHHEAPVDQGPLEPYQVIAWQKKYEVSAAQTGLPPVRLKVSHEDAQFTASPRHIHQVVYRVEQQRGYAHEGDLWSPGFFQIDFRKHDQVALIASSEEWGIIETLDTPAALKAETERRARMLGDAAPAARSEFPAELVFAADQFIISPAGRAEEAARAHATGDEARTVIAGYHWFTDWGRDTMISLEGLTLATGRSLEAGCILRTFAHYVRDGLIPNMFPDGQNEGLYHTADATLWFFHALHRYLCYSRDQNTLRSLLPVLIDIAEHHLRGTRFNIHVDAQDGLLAQGMEGYQLTWMDAKMGDWVVTPRRGKAVELNALWYNALKLLAGWCAEQGEVGGAERYENCAAQTQHSFNHRFWNADGGYLFDVVDCNGQSGTADLSCRPNQLFAISLDHPVLDQERWASVVETAERELLTPVGLRSLAPNDPEYKPIYAGDLRSRDGAYHQGTVWGWLIGPFLDAWLKVHPGKYSQARQFLRGFRAHLDNAGVGTISEVFDARAPHQPGGCIAQAWSVAEVLRTWVKTAQPDED